MAVIRGVDSKQDRERMALANIQEQLVSRTSVLRVEVDVINRQLRTEHQDYLDIRNKLRSDFKIINDK